MKEHIKFTKIENHYKFELNEILNTSDKISITEKLDGANASFTYDEDNKIGVSCFSRNQEIGEHNTLQGFYNWVEENIVPIKNELNPNYRYIGEWLVPHKVLYNEKVYKRFFLFSIYDEINKMYLPDELVIEEAERLNIELVEFFYIGNYISEEHIMQFIGTSELTNELHTGEGIVVKCLNNDKQLFIKFVSDKYAEMKIKSKPKNPLNENQKNLLNELISENRIEKNILKMIDENIIKRDDIQIENFKIILPQIISFNIKDICEEDKDILENIDLKLNVITKYFAKQIPKIVVNLIKNKVFI